MSRVFVGGPAARRALERKPKYGAPCNSCGICCMATQCKLSLQVFGDFASGCPALMENADGVSYRCGLVTECHSPPHREAALLLIGAGDGCDARFNGEPRDEALAAAWDRRDEANVDNLAAALKLWAPLSEKINTTNGENLP